MSYQSITNPKPYSDYVSLKKSVEYIKGSNKVNLIETWRSQTGTAGAVELEEKAGQTIAQIGKTELTLVLASDTNDNAYDAQTVTIHYLDADGVAHAASATFDETDSTTEVAFTDVATGLVAVTDFYCFDPSYGTLAVVSSVAAQTGDNICIGATGCVAAIADPETCVAVILAAATSPTLANLHGVGNIWGRGETNHNDVDSAILTLDYITPWGEIVEGATCTINTTDGTTEVRFVKSDGNYVQDYYRTRKLTTNIAGTANSHAFFITTYNGDAIYGVIEELLYTSVHTRYMVPAASVASAWIGKLEISNGTAAVTLTMTATPKDASGATAFQYIIPYPFMDKIDLPIPYELEPLSELYFTILGNTATFNAHITIVELEA